MNWPTPPPLPTAAPESPTVNHPATTLRRIIVDNLGRDAVILTRYGLVLVDARAAAERPDMIAAWLSSAG